MTLKMTYAPIHRTPMTNLTGLVNKAQPAQDTQDHPMIIPLEQVCYFTIKSVIKRIKDGNFCLVDGIFAHPYFE